VAQRLRLQRYVLRRPWLGAAAPNHPWHLLDRLLDPLRHPESRRWPAGTAGQLAHEVHADRLIDLLSSQGLDAVWYEQLRSSSARETLPEHLRARLEERRKIAIARSLLRERAIEHIAEALGELPWLLFKGAALAHTLYAAPHLRSSADIDLLVAPADRTEALNRLAAAGFAADDPNAAPVDPRQQTLRGHRVMLDLHWLVLRPGRSRVALGELLLAGRRAHRHLWVPAPDHALVIALLHPAVTEYVTAQLNKALDLAYLLQRGDADLDRVGQIVFNTGLAAGAWAMLEWTGWWFGDRTTRDLTASLQPPWPQRAYLAAWMAADPHRLYGRWPNLVRAGFSLALQRHPGDAVRAWWARIRRPR